MPSLATSEAVEFYYEDSGIPESTDNYTTIIFIHGWAHNGALCKKMLPLASKHNFRVVSLYRRDYAPTTLFDEAELRLMSKAPEGQKQFMLERGLEIAHFIEKFVTQNNIPPTQADQRTGGVAVVGWSLGCAFVDAFLSNLDSLSSSTISTLSKYLHTVIHHDHFPVIVGLDNPEEYDTSFYYEPDERKRLTLYEKWVCAYFEHEDINSRDPKKLDFNAVNASKHTFQDTPREELDAMTNMHGYGGSDVVMLTTTQAIVRDRTRRALFDKDIAAKLPDLRVRFYHGGQTSGTTVWAAWQIEKASVDPASSVFGGEKARDIKILHSETGNRFNFWDQPDDALVHYRRCIDA